jgi:diguanylate cyclase (GGDEF)-like protein
MIESIPPAHQMQQILSSLPATDTTDSGMGTLVAVKSSESSLSQQVTALRLLVSELREELHKSHAREKHARYLALHDELTALPNRRYFLERLRIALEQQASESLNLAVIYLDLDGFKTLNDVHGHDVGDQLLNLVAARLSHAVRAEDLVSRLSGDEFACLVAGVPSRERLQHIATTLFDAVATPFQLGAGVFTVYPSIGIGQYPADGTTAEALMHAADVAMYTAKRQRAEASFARRSNHVIQLRLVATARRE